MAIGNTMNVDVQLAMENTTNVDVQGVQLSGFRGNGGW